MPSISAGLLAFSCLTGAISTCFRKPEDTTDKGIENTHLGDKKISQKHKSGECSDWPKQVKGLTYAYTNEN